MAAVATGTLGSEAAGSGSVLSSAAAGVLEVIGSNASGLAGLAEPALALLRRAALVAAPKRLLGPAGRQQLHRKGRIGTGDRPRDRLLLGLQIRQQRLAPGGIDEGGAAGNRCQPLAHLLGGTLSSARAAAPSVSRFLALRVRLAAMRSGLLSWGCRA